MCGRSYSPRFLYMWPNSKISVMGGPQAAGVLSQVANKNNDWDTEKISEFEKPIIDQFDKESSAYFSTARYDNIKIKQCTFFSHFLLIRLWDDGIIDPKDTRKILGLSLASTLNNCSADETKHGIFRM